MFWEILLEAERIVAGALEFVARVALTLVAFGLLMVGWALIVVGSYAIDPYVSAYAWAGAALAWLTAFRLLAFIIDD